MGGLLFAQARPCLLTTLADTTQGSFPFYFPGLLPWHDPIDTLPGFSARLGYYKPYMLWQNGVGIYETNVPPLLPLNQNLYLLREVPLIWSRSPYTRIRFDQLSRKTQLLMIRHGQTFGRGTGFSFAYQRRTRVGEYVGQTTDHYGMGGQVYTHIGATWLRVSAIWNQLQDGINGGILYEEDPWQAFQKERQPVRMNGTRLRRWYRSFQGEWGYSPNKRFIWALTAALREDRIQSTGQRALKPESYLFPDTLPFSFGIREERSQVGIALQVGAWHTTLRQLQHVGISGDPSLIRGWRFSATEIEGTLTLGSVSARGLYRQWWGRNTPPASFYGELRYQASFYEGGVAYTSRNLPWLAMQRLSERSLPPNETIAQLWIEVRLPFSDTTLPPLQVKGWLSQWGSPWLAETTFTSFPTLWTGGLTLRGGWRQGPVGCLTLLNFQHMLPVAHPWQKVVPSLNGWIQSFIQWRLPQKSPLYQFGLRWRGFTAFRLLSFTLPYGTFSLPPFTYYQPASLWIEPYFALLIKRLMIYLCIEHATEGLWSQGYYLTAWYPMPGRAFGFGVQWDIYN